MAIKSICKKNVITIGKESTLQSAAELMQEYHVGSLVVTKLVNGNKVPVGIITDRDLALALNSSQKNHNLKTGNLMRSHPITAKTSDGIFEVALSMRENGIKRLPIIDELGSLYGIICADDLLRLMGEEITNLAKISDTQIRKEKGANLPIEKRLHA